MLSDSRGVPLICIVLSDLAPFAVLHARREKSVFYAKFCFLVSVQGTLELFQSTTSLLQSVWLAWINSYSDSYSSSFYSSWSTMGCRFCGLFLQRPSTVQVFLCHSVIWKCFVLKRWYSERWSKPQYDSNENLTSQLYRLNKQYSGCARAL